MVQCPPNLDATFGALADATRRAVLVKLTVGEASISELADIFDMTLTGMKKHIDVLESAQLVTSEKKGRTRYCTIGPRRLEEVASWVATYQQMLEARLDRLDKFLEHTKEK